MSLNKFSSLLNRKKSTLKNSFGAAMIAFGLSACNSGGGSKPTPTPTPEPEPVVETALDLKIGEDFTTLVAQTKSIESDNEFNTSDIIFSAKDSQGETVEISIKSGNLENFTQESLLQVLTDNGLNENTPLLISYGEHKNIGELSLAQMIEMTDETVTFASAVITQFKEKVNTALE